MNEQHVEKQILSKFLEEYEQLSKIPKKRESEKSNIFRLGNEEKKKKQMFYSNTLDIFNCKWENSDLEIERILKYPTDAIYKFDVLKLPLGASEKLIKTHYRKLSILIHPDKCSNKLAAQAFNIVHVAYLNCINDNKKIELSEIMEEAQVLLAKELKSLNRKRKILGEDEIDEHNFINVESTNKKASEILEERKKKLEYAEKMRKLNQDYQDKIDHEYMAELWHRKNLRKSMKETQFERVNQWRNFKNNVDNKVRKVNKSFYTSRT